MRGVARAPKLIVPLTVKQTGKLIVLSATQEIRRTSLPPPNKASITVSGDSRTGPVPSEASTSSMTSTTSAAVTPARRRAAMSAVTMTFSTLIHRPQPAAPVLDIMISAGQQGSCGKKDALVQSGLQARKCGQRWD